MNDREKRIAKTTCSALVQEVNRNIEKLLQCEEPRWKTQKGKLQRFYDYHTKLMKNNDLDHPNWNTLEQIESIKQWRTANLNTEANMDDIRYGRDIAGLMCAVKVETMASVIKFW